jgi:hypothetical protein
MVMGIRPFYAFLRGFGHGFARSSFTSGEEKTGMQKGTRLGAR